MRALFIGGAVDMTTREVSEERLEIYFFEPEEPLALVDLHRVNPPKDPVLCKKLVYELVTKTRKGVLIYEFVGS